MKNSILYFLFILFPSIGSAQSGNLKLWYNQPATRWVEALPLGNGRLGGMVYGDPENEQLQLNEETIWGGSPYNNTNPKAKDALSKIRELIFQGKNVEAQALCDPAICSQGANGMPYQAVGSLHLDFDGVTKFTDFYRDLDISNAVATTRFRVDGVDYDYMREVFTSCGDCIPAGKYQPLRTLLSSKRQRHRSSIGEMPPRVCPWDGKFVFGHA